MLVEDLDEAQAVRPRLVQVQYAVGVPADEPELGSGRVALRMALLTQMAPRQWHEVYDLCHTFLDVARVKKPTAMRGSNAVGFMTGES